MSILSLPRRESQSEPLPGVVALHLEAALDLRQSRSWLVRAPTSTLMQLGRGDERLAAHLDGLLVAGAPGIDLLGEALRPVDTNSAFVAGCLALEMRDTSMFASLVESATEDPLLARGLASALGWVSAPKLRGITADLIASRDPFKLWLGLCACSMHRVDPGVILEGASQHPDPRVACRALRLAGELGRADLRARCVEISSSDAPLTVRRAAAWSAVLLGDRSVGLGALGSLVFGANCSDWNLLAVLVLASSRSELRSLLRQSANSDSSGRASIWMAALSGDQSLIPWLIQKMDEPALSRLAGSAFSVLSGVNLQERELGMSEPAPTRQDGRTADSDGADANQPGPDSDQGLPWPKADSVAVWWHRHAQVFAGVDCLLAGRESGIENSILQLRQANQLTRSVASLQLKLLQVTLPLFPIVAPERRQRRRLNQL